MKCILCVTLHGESTSLEMRSVVELTEKMLERSVTELISWIFSCFIFDIFSLRCMACQHVRNLFRMPSDNEATLATCCQQWVLMYHTSGIDGDLSGICP